MSFVEWLSREIGVNLEIIKPLFARKGFVYQVRVPSGEKMLLKVVHDQHEETRSIVQEIKLLTFIGNQYRSSGVLGDYHWLLRDWIDGETAWEATAYMRAEPRNKESRIRFIQDLCNMLNSVIKFYQMGYLHGDLQPSHFIKDEEGKYHLIDLELAQSVGDPNPSYRGALVHYVSPEVARGMQEQRTDIPLDQVSEVYSFGAVAYFLYSGVTPVSYGDEWNDRSYHYPFKQKLLAVANGRVRSFAQAEAAPFPELERVIMQCLRQDRRERYQTFQALYEALDQVKKYMEMRFGKR